MSIEINAGWQVISWHIFDRFYIFWNVWKDFYFFHKTIYESRIKFDYLFHFISLKFITSLWLQDIIKCSSCTEDANATSWCVECSEFICDSCVQAHQRLKITKDHTIKPKDTAVSDTQKAANSSKSIMCHVHTQVSSSIETLWWFSSFIY